MPVSEKKKASNTKWDKENMITLGCRVRRDDAAAFKSYCAIQGKTSNNVLKEFVMECTGGSCGPDSGAAVPIDGVAP